MGQSTARCMKVGELVRELRRLDRGLLIRTRDGDAVYPGVRVMRDDRTDHVDIGSPYSIRKRLAEIDRRCRSIDGRRQRSGPKVWVLIRRYEWEDQAQQTECCDPFVFGNRTAAVRKASSLMRSDMRRHGRGFTAADMRCEEKAMLADFRTEYPQHLVELTDGDNVVYELYRREVR